MGDEDLLACGHCSAQVRDRDQSRCPHCLQPLSTRRFADLKGLRAFREDRAAHGAKVPREDPGEGRPLIATLLGLAGALLVLGGVAVGISAYYAGGFSRMVGSIGQAFPMLAFGAAMAAVARQVGGSGA